MLLFRPFSVNMKSECINAKPAKQSLQYSDTANIGKIFAIVRIADNQLIQKEREEKLSVTEIRIYEDHNKVVVCSETGVTDKLLDLLDYDDYWKDDEWTYVRMPLDVFMQRLTETFKS